MSNSKKTQRRMNAGRARAPDTEPGPAGPVYARMTPARRRELHRVVPRMALFATIAAVPAEDRPGIRGYLLADGSGRALDLLAALDERWGSPGQE